jgi:hypothetical protein
VSFLSDIFQKTQNDLYDTVSEYVNRLRAIETL